MLLILLVVITIFPQVSINILEHILSFRALSVQNLRRFPAEWSRLIVLSRIKSAQRASSIRQRRRYALFWWDCAANTRSRICAVVKGLRQRATTKQPDGVLTISMLLLRCLFLIRHVFSSQYRARNTPLFLGADLI